VKATIFLFLVGCLAGCGNAAAPTLVCDGALYPALQLTVSDAKTGSSVASQSTIVASRRGGATDTLVHPIGPLVSVGSLAGTYDVMIAAPGFVSWTMTGVEVPGEQGLTCQPIAVRIDARLQAAP
jgi:hypothetical protein